MELLLMGSGEERSRNYQRDSAFLGDLVGGLKPVKGDDLWEQSPADVQPLLPVAAVLSVCSHAETTS